MEARHILCAVDFSPGSREALELAADLARDHHAVLVLLHVEERALWTAEPYLHLPADVREEVQLRLRDMLEEWKVEAQRRGAPEVMTQHRAGVPWERIVGTAREDPRIEQIVVGSHGRTGLRRALIGSVAERVVRHAPCSVIVARTRHSEA